MTAPALSIVVPMYKEEDSVDELVRQVHSALAEYDGDWELICVDDTKERRNLLSRNETHEV